MAIKNEENRGISSFVIRVVGSIAMFLSIFEKDNSLVADCLFWFAYTIFAFLLVEGINNSSDHILYLRRMILFTAVSEIPYDLLYSGKIWDTKQQSIMVTLLIGFIICEICEFLRAKLANTIINIVAVLSLSTLGILACKKLNAQFPDYGILILMLFYVSYNLSYPKLFELAVMLYYGYTVSTETVLTVTIKGFQYSVPIITFALLATVFTWFYNEERGPNSLALKLLFYCFYPLSLITVYLLNFFGIV